MDTPTTYKRLAVVIVSGIGLFFNFTYGKGFQAAMISFVLSAPMLLGMFWFDSNKSELLRKRLIDILPTVVGVFICLFILAFNDALFYVKFGLIFVMFTTAIAAGEKLRKWIYTRKPFR